MLSSQQKRYWIKCIFLLVAATWIIYLFLPLPSKESQVKNISRIHTSPQKSPTALNWSLQHALYESRLDHVNSVCDKYSLPYFRIFKRPSSNRMKNKKKTKTFCATKQCPVLVDDDHLFYFCFIPKVASTVIKQFFYNYTSTPHNVSVRANPNEFHNEANEALKRISPLYYPRHVLRRYYKVMFVRHPFDRLVSAFRDKAEKPREKRQSFYDKYWDPMMKKYRSSDSVNNSSKPTFQEFVRYLIETNPSQYDDHWGLYWSRCEPCLVRYDFIGKLEDSYQDFQQVSEQLQVENFASQRSSDVRTLSRKYFYSLTAEDVKKLYSVYKLDFEIFGYSIEEFFGSPNYNQSLRPSNHTN